MKTVSTPSRLRLRCNIIDMHIGVGIDSFKAGWKVVLQQLTTGWRKGVKRDSTRHQSNCLEPGCYRCIDQTSIT
jgi:hypothetical protein